MTISIRNTVTMISKNKITISEVLKDLQNQSATPKNVVTSPKQTGGGKGFFTIN